MARVTRPRRKTPLVPLTDPVAKGCLEQIRRGYLDAVGVLADLLEETGHSHALRLRSLYNHRWDRINLWKSQTAEHYQTGTKWTRWESVSYELHRLRYEVQMLFGRTGWSLMQYKEVHEKNQQLYT